MSLTKRQVRLLGYGGLLLIVVSPVIGVYSLEYRMVERTVPSEPDSDEIHAYDSLSPELQTAVDRALADSGEWYRSYAEAPVDVPFVVEREGALYAFTLNRGYHWSSWQGKAPVVIAIVGLGGIVVAIRRGLRGESDTSSRSIK